MKTNYVFYVQFAYKNCWLYRPTQQWGFVTYVTLLIPLDLELIECLQFWLKSTQFSNIKALLCELNTRILHVLLKSKLLLN